MSASSMAGLELLDEEASGLTRGKGGAEIPPGPPQSQGVDLEVATQR
jgi:hypothetical protein